MRERLYRSRRAIKVALLDQRAIAGIGNLYASEILHVANIHPATRCHRLRRDDWNRLHAATHEILELAIRHEGSTLADGTYRNALNQSGDYQNHHRVYDRAGQTCLTCRRGSHSPNCAGSAVNLFLPRMPKTALIFVNTKPVLRGFISGSPAVWAVDWLVVIAELFDDTGINRSERRVQESRFLAAGNSPLRVSRAAGAWTRSFRPAFSQSGINERHPEAAPVELHHEIWLAVGAAVCVGGIGNRHVAVRNYDSRTLPLEQLEARQMMTVTLDPLHGIQVPGGQSVLVPLTGLDSGNGALTYSFSSSDPANVTLELVSPTSKSLKLNVSGTDKNGLAFTGTLVLHLFEDLTPQTTTRIETLVGQSFYTGKQFFRVLDGFVAQNNGSTGTLIPSEIVSSLNFVSPGLLAMANAGPNTNDAQFFITAIDGAGTTNPITLARMPQSLSGNYTIFGQLVSGFDTFEKIMQTPVKASTTFTGEVSQPISTITITSAQIITDTQNAVLRVSAPASFDNNGATISVTATNTNTNESDTETFAADVVVDPPTLGPVSNQTITVNTAANFTLTSHKNDASAGVVYEIIDATTLAAPQQVTISIDQTTGAVTITPDADFAGVLKLLAGVRADSAENDVQANFDTLPFTLTVKPLAPTSLALDPSSNTGPFDGNGYISTGTPTLNVNAQTGGTVQFLLNGTVIGTAAETSPGSGQLHGSSARRQISRGHQLDHR